MTEALIAALALMALLGVIGWFLGKLIWDGTEAAITATDYGRKFAAYSTFITAISSAHQFIRKDFINAIASFLVLIVIFPLLAYVVGYIFGVSKQRSRKKVAPGKEDQVASKNIPSSIEDNDEDEIYALIAEELDTGTMDKGLWTRLFAECDGDEKRVKVLYITRRFKKLKGAEKVQNKLNSQEAERIEQEALRVSMGEEAHRQTAGIAELTLPDAILNEGGTVPSAILGSSAHDIDINAKGISVPDLEKMRGDEQIVRLLHDFSIKSPGDYNVSPSMDNEKVSEAIKNFQSGKTPTNDEVNFLMQAALKNPSIAKISDRLYNNTLLHWCARLSLSREASILIRLQADAKAFNSAGQQAHQLAKSPDFRTMLAAAANGEKVA